MAFYAKSFGVRSEGVLKTFEYSGAAVTNNSRGDSTTDYAGNTAAEIIADSFFDDVADRISTGDLLVYLGSDSTLGMGMFTNTDGVITLAAVDVDPTA